MGQRTLVPSSRAEGTVLVNQLRPQPVGDEFESLLSLVVILVEMGLRACPRSSSQMSLSRPMEEDSLAGLLLAWLGGSGGGGLASLGPD